MAKTTALKGVKAHTRYYLADGTRVPGCTTVTGVLNKPALVRWANNLGLDGIDVSNYTDRLADAGTLVHHMILCDIQGQVPDLDAFAPQVVRLAENSFISYLAWRRAHTVEPIICEQPMVSETHRYGGTPDLYAKVDGVNALVDFKSGSGIYAEHFHQVAGGYLLLLEERGLPVERIVLLNIPRDEDEAFVEIPLTIESPAVPKHREMFLLCRRVYQLQQELKPGRHYAKKEEAAS